MKCGISGIKATVRHDYRDINCMKYGNLLGPRELSVIDKCPCREFWL